MLEQTAVNYYLGKNGKSRMNCGMSVAQAVEDLHPGKGNPENFAYCGSGNAPGGLCGALYAAQTLTKNNSDAQQKITEAFINNGGAITCRDIRAQRKLPCHKCVALAAQSLAKTL